MNLCPRHYVCVCIRSVKCILPVSCARIPLLFYSILIFYLSANEQSETYVLKQQGHLYGISTLDFSSDGQYIATGGDDSKVKLWNASSGFCFVTFSEHVAPITGKWVSKREGGQEGGKDWMCEIEWKSEGAREYVMKRESGTWWDERKRMKRKGESIEKGQ